MSKLALRNGDDHPEAAKKHLSDADVLVNARRFDGAAYLAGYVIESCLKALVILEHGSSGPGLKSHDLRNLASAANTLLGMAGARAGKYVGSAVRGLATARIMAWKPEMRYHAPSIIQGEASAWIREARSVYHETIGQMILDGII